MTLEPKDFLFIVDNAPLVSIDLIVRSTRSTTENKILLGLRRNRPAQNTWFVPGGRIDKKWKSLSEAFHNITKNELGIVFEYDDTALIKVTQHFYENDNFANKEGIDTYYVVIALEFFTDKIDINNLPMKQHEKWDWFSEEKLLRKEDVHEYVKKYFDMPIISKTQYSIVANRRQTYDTLLWQSPALCLTAQAFLMIIILSGEADIKRILAAILSLLVSIATYLLIKKHRSLEIHDSRLLEKFETANINKGFKIIHVPRGLKKLKLVKIWLCITIIFGVVAIVMALHDFVVILPSWIKIFSQWFSFLSMANNYL